jgi:hypothetical protein
MLLSGATFQRVGPHDFFLCSFLAVEEPGSASAHQPKIEERIRRLQSEVQAIVKPQ